MYTMDTIIHGVCYESGFSQFIIVFCSTVAGLKHRSRGIPNQLMLKNNKARMIDPRVIPTSDQAVQLYEQNGGRLTEPVQFGRDPLECDAIKKTIREQAFQEKYPSLDLMFHQLVNGDTTLFQQALKFYISTTHHLSHT